MNRHTFVVQWTVAETTDFQSRALVAALVVATLAICGFVVIVIKYGALWLEAYMAGANVPLLALVGMTFRRVPSRLVVTAMIMVKQAGVGFAQQHLRTAPFEAHVLAGGDLLKVVQAIIAAHRAGIDLDFDRATAIDLAGRDVLSAVQTSVSPKVIDCPDPDAGTSTLSAVAKNGVELRIRARVTVRTNLNQLVGGATEQTIIARVGQGMISAVGSSPSHTDVLELPDRISKSVLRHGLDSNTAFEIVSIDMTDIDVGENIGARLQIDQAAADMRMSRALAEVRRAEAIASFQQMKAKVAENRARLVLAEADVPVAMAEAFRAGNIHTGKGKPTIRVIGGDDTDQASA